MEILENGKAYIVHYDEQFPKKGRCQKFRLSLFDAKTKNPIEADERLGILQTFIETMEANDLDNGLISTLQSILEIEYSEVIV